MMRRFTLVFDDVYTPISLAAARDPTGRNLHVLYEARIARILEHHLVSITQSPGDIPFDVQQYRYLQYLNDQDGRLTDIGAGLGINPHS
jgi:hypothetical protein